MTAATAPAPTPSAVSAHADVVQSVRNAVKLGASLLATWAVAVAVRVVLPRALGPDVFGVYQFADAFSATAFMLTHLGVETYVRKEVATRPEHATEFFGGMLVARLALSAVVMVGATAVLIAGGKGRQVCELALVLGAAQVLVNLNGVYGALLHSKGTVDGLSILNVVSKLLWGAGIGVALLLGTGVMGVAVALLASETLRTGALALLSRRHLMLRMRLDRRATTMMLAASLPYYLASLAQTVYSKIDISVMSFMTNDREVGWYGAASNVAGVSLLLSPLIGWVLLPLTARAAARSEDALTALSRRSMELILMAAIPVSLLLFLGADVLVATLFGAQYAPAARSLRVLAPLFMLTYAAMVSGSMLIRLDRGWALTWISVAGGVASPLLNVWLIPRTAARFGAGGAGVGAGIALIATELGTTIVMTALLGGRAFDRRSIVALAKALGACAATALADRLLLPIGAWRFLVDALVYTALIVASGAMDIRGMLAFVRDAMRSDDGALAAAPGASA